MTAGDYARLFDQGTYLAGLGAFMWILYFIVKKIDPSSLKDGPRGPTLTLFRWLVLPVGLVFMTAGALGSLLVK